MPSISSLLLPLTLFLATTTAATCPNNWLENTFGGDSKCCYGNMLVEDTDAYCCVYDMTFPKETSVSTTSSFDDSWSTAGDCFAKIPFTASDYSAQVSSASSKILAATTTIATNEATSTTASSTSSSTSGMGLSSTASTSNAAMPIATAQEMVLGGAAVVVGLFML